MNRLEANQNKNNLLTVPCEQFLQQIEISHTPCETGRRKAREFQFVAEIPHKAVVLILISL